MRGARDVQVALWFSHLDSFRFIAREYVTRSHDLMMTLLLLGSGLDWAFKIKSQSAPLLTV